MKLESSEKQLMRAIDDAHEVGVKLEVHQGLPIWEFLPSPLHTIEAKRIEQSIRRSLPASTDCGYFSFQDMTIRFPDGSIRQPDIAVFCETPAATQEATEIIPRAIIEIVSPGSEIKDLELSPAFYLMHGVLDVLVFEPRTGVVSHFRRDARHHLNSPVELHLECGCSVTV
jgi:Uma2 family endonuclease